MSERVVGTRTGACWNWEHHQFPEARWWPALRDLLDLDDETWGPVIAEAERVKTGEHAAGLATGSSGVGGSGEGKDRKDRATTEAAARWQGWGTALKPAFEPIVVARKPLAGTVAANVLQHGTGALNIDGCRVGNATGLQRPERRGKGDTGGWANYEQAPGQYGTPDGSGRWPTNVVLDDTQAAELDRQSGVLTSGRLQGHHKRSGASGIGTFEIRDRTGEPCDFGGDSGGASRFFPTFRYEAKAPTSERPRITRPMLRLRGDLTPAQVDHVRARLAEAGVQVD